jgi:hypothetical protein
VATVGWAAVVIGFLTSLFGVLRYFFDQISGVSESAIKAIEALRKVRRAIRGTSAPNNSSDFTQAQQDADRPLGSERVLVGDPEPDPVASAKPLPTSPSQVDRAEAQQ